MQLGSVEIVAEDRIKYNGKLYQATEGEVPGRVTVTGNFLSGPQNTSVSNGPVWEAMDGFSKIAPTSGPAFRGKVYIPRPHQVEQAFNGEEINISWHMPSEKYCSQCGKQFNSYQKKWYCQGQTICDKCHNELY